MISISPGGDGIIVPRRPDWPNVLGVQVRRKPLGQNGRGWRTISTPAGCDVYFIQRPNGFFDGHNMPWRIDLPPNAVRVINFEQGVELEVRQPNGIVNLPSGMMATCCGIFAGSSLAMS